MDQPVRVLTPQDFGFMNVADPSRGRPLYRQTVPGMRLILDIEPRFDRWEACYFPNRNANPIEAPASFATVRGAIEWFEAELEINLGAA